MNQKKNAVRVNWKSSVYTKNQIENEDLEGYHLYSMITMKKVKSGGITLEIRDTDVLYIGMTHKQDVGTRIVQPHKEAQTKIDNFMNQASNKNKPIRYIIGKIISFDEDITEDFIRDVECCLIFRNQPVGNDKCKESYPRGSIIIQNEGYFTPLRNTSQCEKNNSSQKFSQ